MRNSLIMAALIMAALILAGSAAAPAARAAGSGEVQKVLQTDYSDRDGAVARKDIDGTLAHYAPDFTSVSTTGKSHDLAKERVDFLKTFSLPAKSSVIKSTIDKVTLGKSGTEAIVAVRRHGILLFVNPQTKLNDVLVLDGAYQDTWTKRPAGWQMVREQASSLKATMNGKPL